MPNRSDIENYWRHRHNFERDAAATAIGQALHPAITIPLPVAVTGLLGNDIVHYALADHQHAHDNLPGGTLHALVNSTAAGFAPPFTNVPAFFVLSVINGHLSWREISEMGTGDVIGPDVSVDGDVVLMDGTTGKIIKDSGIAVADLLTADNHEALRQLIHFIDQGPAGGFASGAYSEQLPAANPFPNSKTWYVDSTKAKKIVDQVVVRDGSQNITTSQWRVYAADGVTILETVLDTITRSGPFEVSRTRTIS